jgi:hypothetical protein
VLLVGGGLLFLDATLGSGMCQTTVFARAFSPSDGVVAQVQMTDCGATTGFSRVVMLEKPGLWTRECRALALNGEPRVSLSWKRSELSIAHTAPTSDIIAKSEACFGHAIRFTQER